MSGVVKEVERLMGTRLIGLQNTTRFIPAPDGSFAT